jgi:hypothetical protein
MAEQRIDGFSEAGAPSKVLASAPCGVGDAVGGYCAGQFGSGGGGITVQTFLMRGKSALLGNIYVPWIATTLDTAGSQAPPAAGTLTDIVWLRTI